jgi:hypothetical protein
MGFDAGGLPIALSGTGNDTALRTDLASAVSGSDGSRLAGFRRAETGAAARTVYAKLFDRVSASDFGADPTASAAANAIALNAALVLARYVSIDKPGTYVISTNLDMASNGTLDIGPGVVLQAAPVGTWVGTIGKGMIDVNGKTGARVTGSGTIDGNKAANAAGRIWGIHCTGAIYPTIDGRLRIINCPGQDATGINQGDGICVRGNSSGALIRGVTFDGNVRQCISMTSCDGYHIDSCRGLNTTGSAPGAFIDCEADVPGTLKNGLITNCYCDNNYISLQAADADGLQVDGCNLKGARFTDLNLIRVTRLSITNTMIVPNPSVAQNAIIFAFQVLDSHIDVNIVGNYDPQEGAAIRLSDGCKRIHISGNIYNTYAIALQIGASSLGEDIEDIFVEGLRQHNVTDPSVNSPAVFIDGNSGGGFHPRRIHIARSCSIIDTRTGGNEATAGVQVSTNIPAAVVSGYRIEPGMISGPTVRMANPPLWGSVTWNPASLADGAGETSPAITVTGAAVGDSVEVFPPENLLGGTYCGYVSAANTVTIRFQNESGGVIDLNNSNWFVRVRKLYE